VPRNLATIKGIQIISVSCNNNVAIFVSKDGTLYSFGDDLKYRFGILGLNDIYHQPSPIPIRGLLDHSVKQVSVGFSHCSALDSTGVVYIWGTSGVQKKSNSPVLLKSERVINARQTLSSYFATIVVTSILYKKFIENIGGGYVYIYGSLKNSTLFQAKTSANLLSKEAEESKNGGKPQMIEKLVNEFITKIASGEGFLTALTSIDL